MRLNPTVLVFLLPVCSLAQDCNLKKTTDPYTKETRYSSGLIALKGAGLSIDGDSKEINFFFTVDSKEKCFNDACTAVIIYEGTKQKATFRNSGPMNCDGFFHIIFKNGVATPTLLQRLVTQKIISIEINDSNKAKTTIYLSPEEQQKISTYGSCVVNESKALVK
jgi:hypothetical protein